MFLKALLSRQVCVSARCRATFSRSTQYLRSESAGSGVTVEYRLACWKETHRRTERTCAHNRTGMHKCVNTCTVHKHTHTQKEIIRMKKSSAKKEHRNVFCIVLMERLEQSVSVRFSQYILFCTCM